MIVSLNGQGEGEEKNFMPQNLFHLTHEASRFFLVSPSTVRRP
jgi:hypothetical protein